MHSSKSQERISVQVYSAEKKSSGPVYALMKIAGEFPAAHALGWRFALRNLRALFYLRSQPRLYGSFSIKPTL
jgi:hypothetical protein